MEKSKTYEELLKDMELIMKEFDFEMVRAYMLVTNWKWYAESNDGKVPTIEELTRQASYSLSMVINSEEPASNAGSGGLMAYKLPWGLKLAFEPFKYSSF